MTSTNTKQKKGSSISLGVVIEKMEADTKWVNKNYVQLDYECIYLFGGGRHHTTVGMC